MSQSDKKRRRSAAKRFADVERIAILGVTEYMGPIALHMYADRYLFAARSLPAASEPFEPVRPYLACHSIELALKAFLSLRGKMMLDLAEGEYGHRLASLLDAADHEGLKDFVSLQEPHRRAIRVAETYYQGKVFEYPAVGEAMSAYPHMPPLDTLLQAAEILVTNLARHCREAR